MDTSFTAAPADRSRWDGLLESSIVGSFTKLGHCIRSRAWDPIDGPALDGKVMLITGATSGIGKQVARQAASYGARLRFVARNRAKAEDFDHELKSISPHGDIEFYLADLSLVSEVRRVAEDLLGGEPQIDVLINNAVVLPDRRRVTDEGLELSHATNLVAPFVLTNALIPRLIESRPARIINVISGGMYLEGLALDDLNYEQGRYRGSVAYARAKRRLLVLTKIWAHQLGGTGVTVNATHPGWVDTPGVKDSLPTFYRLMKPGLRNLEQGSDTILWLATAEQAGHETGKLWHDRAQRPEHRFNLHHEGSADRDRLWDELAETVAALQPA
jgi:NAD(P)-dependent dehydrogenase (short-subunit alcohol dehydrogenase family)